MFNNKSQLTPLERFWGLIYPDRKEIKNVYVYAIFSGIVNLSLPLGIQAIINLIQGAQINSSWMILVLLVTLGVGLNGLLSIFQLRIVENLQQKIFTKAAIEFAYRIPRIKMEQWQKKYAPELMNRFFDIVSIQKGLSTMLIDFSTASLQIIFGLILLSFYHPFFIIFSLTLLILIGLIFRLTAKKGLETSIDESTYKYKTVHWLEEVARTTLTFKLAGDSKLPLQNTDKVASKYLEMRESHFQVLLKQYSLMVGFKVMMTLGLLAIGGILVMEQEMNIGQFVAAEIIILLLMNSIERLIKSLETIYDVLTGLEKVGAVTDLELEKSEGMDMEKDCSECGMQIELIDFNFHYPGDKKIVLNKLNFVIQSGSIVAITGKNGSGKSTLLRVLAGLYENEDGQILLDSINKSSFSFESLRSAIGDHLSQEELFEGSLKDNLCMGKAIPFEEMQKTCKNVKLLPFIHSLKDGYETTLDPQGKRLSENIVQKILLARAYLNAKKLLLLEDSLEIIDKKERIEIIDFLKKNEKKLTIVFVTKNEYFIAQANQVINLEDGKITYNGSYENYLKFLNQNA